MSDAVSQDFVFGTLATDDLRLAQVRAARAGVAHACQLDPADPQPGDAVTVHVRLGPQVVADHVTCYHTVDGSEPAGARGVATHGSAVACARAGVEWDTLLWGYVERWAGTLPAQPAGTLVRYRIEAWATQGGASRWASEIAGVTHGERPPLAEPFDAQLFAIPGQAALWPVRRAGSYAFHVDSERVPDWLRDAVIYHVFIDRFATAGGAPFAVPATPGGFYGGTLRGALEQIEYIANLGATCIWLSPFFASPSHHGYDATDYQRVEPRLGSLEDVRALIDAAHARGMRVLLDYVVNHISSAHPVFQRALAAPDAAEAGWFTFTRWPDQYLSFFGVPDLPQIDSDAAPARDYMIDCARYWLEQGVDGFRLDYANGPSHAFWSQFRAATRAAQPASVTLGEVVETPALQASYQGQMDGCLDFLLLQALRQLFAFGTLAPSAFDAFLQRHLAFFPADFVTLSFLDNHDMNRFLWVVGGDTRRLKLAALCQFTLPHPPIVYYGTEVGLSQARDVRYADGSGHPEESRLPMLWGAAQNYDLLHFYQRLVALRRATARLWRGERRTLAADDTPGLYAYSCAAGSAQAIVVLNTGEESAAFFVEGSAAAYRLACASDQAILFERDTLVLAPLSGAVLLAAGGAAQAATA